MSALARWLEAQINEDLSETESHMRFCSAKLAEAFKSYWAPTIQEQRYSNESFREFEVHGWAKKRARARRRIRMLRKAILEANTLCGRVGQ